jgi:predicted component of type VI protein secretion system
MEKSVFRDIVYEFILIIEENESEELPQQKINKKIFELQNSLDEKMKNFTPCAVSRQSEECNLLFNHIKTLKLLQQNFKKYQKKLMKIATNKETRNKVKAEIEEIDYDEKPSLLNRIIDNFLFILNGRPK